MGNIVDPFTWRMLLYDFELRVPQFSQSSTIGHSAVSEFRKPMKANDELWKKQLNSAPFPNIYTSALLRRDWFLRSSNHRATGTVMFPHNRACTVMMGN